MTAAPLLALHVPDEPTVRAEYWLSSVLGGEELDGVLLGEGGFVDWLWPRWSTLDQIGMPRDALSRIVLGYRREIWLWLAGERTWAHCCTGLLGRINRRLGPSDSAAS